MVGGKGELELAVGEGALGGDVHEFPDQVTEPEILELDLSKQIVPKPRKQVEGNRRHLQKVLDGCKATGAKMSNLQAMLGGFDQGLDALAVVVAGEDFFGIRLGSWKIGVKVGIKSAILAMSHQLGQDDTHRITAMRNRLGAQFADAGKQVQRLPLRGFNAGGKIDSRLITNAFDDKAQTEFKQFLNVGAATEGGIGSNQT
jgi:hypothetical protein